MISKQSISNINAPSYSQAKTRLDLSNHPIFKTQEINNSSEEDFVSMDEATLIGNTLQAISPKINHLILDNNELGERTMEELVIIFKAIPQSILHLTIKANDLYDAGSKRNNKNISEIQAFENIVDALSKGYLSVDLSDNELNKMHVIQLFYLAAKLSPKLEKLKLCNNLLGSHFDQHLVHFFQQLPKKLKYLYLSGNDLFNRRDNESAVNILNALPDSLIYLDVTDNPCWDPEVEIEERMVSIYPLLKPSIQKAINYLHEKPNFIVHRLDQMIFGKKQNYNDIRIKASQLPVKISESLLQKLVHLLEKTKDCSSFFIAGLLLEGRIPSQISSDFSASELRNYCLKRQNDALTLYMSSGYFMDEPSSKTLAINFLIAQRTASVIRPCLLAPTPDHSKKEDSLNSNRGLSF